MPQLNLDTYFSQIFWLFLTFALIYFFVAKIFVPKIGRAVEGRKSSIKNNVAKAENFYVEQKEIAADIQRTLDESRQQSASLKNDAVKKAEIFYNEEVRKVEKDISSKMVTEEQKLSRFKAKLQVQVEELSGMIASEVKEFLLKANNTRKN